MRLVPLLTAALLAAGPAAPQDLQVPIRIPPSDGQMADCPSSYVDGLNPNGDNFLAVRTGPGSDYAKIDEIHTGDVVYVCDVRGPWHGVQYKGENIKSGFQARHGQRTGWVHSRYLRFLAG